MSPGNGHCGGARFDRRKVLGMMAATLAAPGPASAVQPAGSDIAAVLRQISVRLVAEPHFRKFGRLWLAEHPALGAARIERQVLAALDAAGTTPEFPSKAALIDSLRKTVRADFRRRRIAHVGGWRLARTEIQLCALGVLQLRGRRTA